MKNMKNPQMLDVLTFSQQVFSTMAKISTMAGTIAEVGSRGGFDISMSDAAAARIMLPESFAGIRQRRRLPRFR